MTGSDRSFFIRIVRACHTRIEPSWWRYHLPQEAFWRLYHNAEDGASVTTSSGTLPLRRGHFYVIPAHLRLDLRCERTIHHFYAHFDVAGLPDIALQRLFQTPWGVPGEDHHRKLLAAASLGLLPEPGQPVAITAQCWLTALIYELLAERLQAIPPEQVDHCWHFTERVQPVLPAIELIAAGPAEDLSNARLAAACSMSEGYFIRTFRTCTGQTPAQYTIERRIQRAAEQLLLTTDSIEKIADDCGFGSRAYFTRVFTRQIGIPPASFRRSHFPDVY